MKKNAGGEVIPKCTLWLSYSRSALVLAMHSRDNVKVSMFSDLS